MKALAFLLVLVISLALIGYAAFSDRGALTETVEVGSQGIKKAEEVKRLLEESSRAQSEI